MLKIIKWCLTSWIVLFISSNVYALTNPLSPVGYWKTIDDETGQPKAIVQIWEGDKQKLYGRILKIYPRPGYDQNEVCSACEGDKHNKRIVGMIFIEGLQQDKDDPLTWKDGSILDPKNGKTYHCKVRTIENGQKLYVRGYIGLPLFGRTQTWLRTSGL